MGVEAVQRYAEGIDVPVHLKIGAQWGDEGKGKIVDEESRSEDMVIRYQGGNNAGHSVAYFLEGYNSETYYAAEPEERQQQVDEFKFNIIPSGILHGAQCVVSAGAVVDLRHIAGEIDALQRRGVKVDESTLFVSDKAHVIMPWHIDRDRLKEKSLGDKKVGTTNRGISPAYQDKVGRTGLVVADFFAEDFEERLIRELLIQERRVKEMDGEDFISMVLEQQYSTADGDALRALAGQHVSSIHYDPDRIIQEYRDYREIIGQFRSNTHDLILNRYYDIKHNKRKDIRNIIGEGAQGALLDIDLGTYPYVTSSNTGYAGFLKVTGINPKDIHSSAVFKAYQTRVGEGPLPTEELFETEMGQHFLNIGKERGTTTGRERRSGWFDPLVTRYTLDHILFADDGIITKLDVLDGLKIVKICRAYKIGNELITHLTSADQKLLAQAEPVYEEMEGWENTKGIENFEDFPIEAKRYLARIEELMGVPIRLVGTGPVRGQTVYRAA